MPSVDGWGGGGGGRIHQQFSTTAFFSSTLDCQFFPVQIPKKSVCQLPSTLLPAVDFVT